MTDRVRLVPGGLSEDHGAAAARTLLAEVARPTAVLAFNDHCAIGVLDAFLRARIPVPDEILGRRIRRQPPRPPRPRPTHHGWARSPPAGAPGCEPGRRPAGG
ncbi:substrate-binding domain-containing protein [Streptomyces sp. NPDC002817]